MSHSSQNESIKPTPYLYTLRSPITYTNTLPITNPHLKTSPNTVGFRPKLKSSRQPIRIDHENALNFLNQSESSIATPKNTRELSARVEVTSRLWAQVGSLWPILIHGGTSTHHLISSHSYYSRCWAVCCFVWFFV